MVRVSRVFQATGTSQQTLRPSTPCPRSYLSTSSLTTVVFGSLLQEGKKRLLGFTKRGTATHSVSCQILNLLLVTNP